MDVSIEDSITLADQYPSVVERYYTPYYRLANASETQGPSSAQLGDQCVLIHSNKICLVALAPSHPILTLKKTPVKLDFQASANVNRLDNTIKGKGKKGGQYLQENSILCTIECSDGTRYAVQACIRGKLVEINQHIIENPQLLITKPQSEGFIAVILQKLSDRNNLPGLVDSVAYKKHVIA